MRNWSRKELASFFIIRYSNVDVRIPVPKAGGVGRAGARGGRVIGRLQADKLSLVYTGKANAAPGCETV